MKVLTTLAAFALTVPAAVFAVGWMLFPPIVASIAAGTVLALVILTILLAGWKIRSDLEAIAKPLRASLTGEVTLVKKRGRHFRHQRETEELARQLAAEGFVHAGFYQLKDFDTFLEGFASPRLDAYAAVYDTDPGLREPWVDILTPYADGGSYCCTTADPAVAGVMPRPDTMRLAFPPGKNIADAVAFMRENRPEGQHEIVTERDFQTYFENFQRRHFEWLVEQRRDDAAD